MSSFDFFCLTFFLFPPAGYSLCRHAPSAESFARSHWSICPRPPVVPVIHATRVRHQLRSPTMAAASQATLYDPPAPALSPAPPCAPRNDNDTTRHGDDAMATTRQQHDNDNDTATTTMTQR